MKSILVDTFESVHSLVFLLVFTIALSQTLEVDSLVLILVLTGLLLLAVFMIAESVICLIEILRHSKAAIEVPELHSER